MNKFDIAFGEPFSEIDVLVDDDLFPRLADKEASSDKETEDEDADDEDTEDEEMEDEEVSDEVEKS